MCMACEMDPAKAEGFAGSIIEMINQGALGILVSMGHQLGLFDAMVGVPPISSLELAASTGLLERYVREWLYAMAAGRIVEVDISSTYFHLPPEHAQFLSRKFPGDNLALFAQYIPVLAGVEQQVIQCFKQGGGVPYEQYGRFHEVMAEDSGQTILGALFEHILPLVPGLLERLESGVDVLDIGCGSGRAMVLMGETFPNSRFLGIDLCEAPLTAARQRVREKGLNNVHFIQADLTTFCPEGKFDLITAFDAIHDQARPDLVLATVYDCLLDDGVFLMQDIDSSEKVANNLDHPFGRLLYSISTLHCTSVSLAQGGMGLGTMWGTEQANRMLRAAGFRQITENRLPHDPMNCYFVVGR
ncbi:putative transcriptional regulatory protein [Lunatimonas lonarensis]|uniref:Putative transcriptional regulatory protein n=1 Tax=Lunatimonas lonarensis TaxID=1232681 RepID=R7ZW46_9BACT|nr:methyltransferase domain-containing protein [Lunatimonas lonarensis]EON78370.1 putative transcriptional regulatory protein [Lunatimonas lonarensis]